MRYGAGMKRSPDGNLFAHAEPPSTGERMETLRRIGPVHIERIVSSATPEPGTYVQAQDEWVALLTGGAELSVADERVSLTPGDHIFLPARIPHTVVSTMPGTVWLAVHVAPTDPTPA